MYRDVVMKSLQIFLHCLIEIRITLVMHYE